MEQRHDKSAAKAERAWNRITTKGPGKLLYPRGKIVSFRPIQTGRLRPIIAGIGSTVQIFPQPYRVTVGRNTQSPLARAVHKLSKNASAIRSKMPDTPTGTDGWPTARKRIPSAIRQ